MLCYLILKDIIKYYQNIGVYACVVDASKAFDSVQHDNLFALRR